MFDIVKTTHNYDGSILIEGDIVKTVCNEHEAKRLLEVCFRGDSFTKYIIKKR